MAPPALSTRDTRTSLYTYPPSPSSLIRFSLLHYLTAPALPTPRCSSTFLYVCVCIYISLSLSLCFCSFLDSSLCDSLSFELVSLSPRPVFFNPVSGSPCLLYRSRAVVSRERFVRKSVTPGMKRRVSAAGVREKFRPFYAFLSLSLRYSCLLF